MQNKKWKKFDKLTGKCYENMIGAEKDGSCWSQTFELLLEIVREERQEDPNYASQLEMLEEATDYEYDILGWLTDCLDEIDMRDDHATLLKMCDGLLNTFDWPEYTGSDIKFQKSIALRELGKTKESAEFCKKWVQKEPENVAAATAAVYALIAVKEFEEANQLVDLFVLDKTQCSDENEIMFTAASKLYEAEGKRKEKKVIDKAIKEYEKWLDEFLESAALDEEDGDFDWEMPFL